MDSIRPIESDALCGIVELYQIQTELSQCPSSEHTTTISMDGTSVSSKGNKWEGYLDSAHLEESFFSLFEWLLRLPESEQKLTLVNEKGKKEYLFPRNENRAGYRMMMEQVEAKMAGLSPLPAYVTTIQRCFNDSTKEKMLQELSRQVLRSNFNRIHSEYAFAERKDKDQAEIELTVYHPLVIISRLRAVYLLAASEKKKKRVIEDSKTALPFSKPENTALDVLPIMNNYLCQPIQQFYCEGNDKDASIYMLDLRQGCLSSLLYRKGNAFSSLRPINICTIAEKLALDIREYLEEHSNNKNIRGVSVCLIGSIGKTETKYLAEALLTYRGFYNPNSQRNELQIALNILSREKMPENQEYSKNNRSVHVRWLQFDHYSTYHHLEELILSNSIAFLIDNSFLYRQYTNAVEKIQERAKDFFSYSDNPRIRILDCFDQLSGQYMQYNDIYKLSLDGLLSDLTEMHREKPQYENTHLCALFSYSKFEDLIRLSKNALEVRKELVGPRSYTTLFRYRNYWKQKDERKDSPPIENDADSQCFYFRLHQWYKMMDQGLDDRKIVIAHEETNLATALRSVVCSLRYSTVKKKKKWICELHSIEEFDENFLAAVQKSVKKRFDLISDDQAFPAEVRYYLRKSLVNLLISRSTNLTQLLLANAFQYFEERNISINISNQSSETILESLYQYETRMRQYHDRYSDYLFLCSLNKSSLSFDQFIKIFDLIEAFGRDDGLYTIRQIENLCCDFLSMNAVSPKEIEKYYQRTMNQARFILQ